MIPQDNNLCVGKTIKPWQELSPVATSWPLSRACRLTWLTEAAPDLLQGTPWQEPPAMIWSDVWRRFKGAAQPPSWPVAVWASEQKNIMNSPLVMTMISMITSRDAEGALLHPMLLLCSIDRH